MIPVEKIVGSVDRVREFDPKFRPRTGLSRQRFERIDEAVRRGESLPPIDVYQVGDIYFVRDGHHRVAVHRALDLPEIEADVRLVRTVVEPDDVQARSDLAARELRKLFLQRVPVAPRAATTALILSDPRAVPVVRGDGGGMGRPADVRRANLPGPSGGRGRWYAEEFVPVVKMIEDGDLLGKDETEADAYMRVAGERYAVFHHHDVERRDHRRARPPAVALIPALFFFFSFFSSFLLPFFLFFFVFFFFHLYSFPHLARGRCRSAPSTSILLSGGRREWACPFVLLEVLDELLLDAEHGVSLKVLVAAGVELGDQASLSVCGHPVVQVRGTHRRTAGCGEQVADGAFTLPLSSATG